MKMNKVKLANFEIGGGEPLVLLAGPCVLEGLERSLLIGRGIKEIADRLGIPYVFKASFDKANRSAYHSFRGPGLEEGVKILGKIRDELGVPVVTDIHETSQAEPVAKVADILQIPAFLSRQTDLLHAAAQTGGESFGYNNLVVDMRSFPIMRSFGYPVIFDGTHSVQLPGGAGTSSGGQREYVEYLVRAAVGAGVDGLFLEVHDNPPEALSDGANMVYLDKLEDLLKDALAIYEIVRKKLN